ncbi:MAG: hypothetical protein WCQ49_02795 [Candidatus Saccharibacteria bacterium]
MTWLWVIFIVFLIFSFVVFIGSPYVPSQKKYIKQAFTKLYKITDSDVLVDIGSGDGVVLREAAKLGARAYGYEINPLLILISRLLSLRYKKIKISLVDFWYIKIPVDTTVIYIFSVTRDINNITKLLQKEIDRIKKPVYLISYAGDFTKLKLIKKVGPYGLYLINPLQLDKAQV